MVLLRHWSLPRALKVIILTQLLVLYVWSGIQKLGKKLHRYLENDRGDLGDLPDCCPH